MDVLLQWVDQNSKFILMFMFPFVCLDALIFVAFITYLIKGKMQEIKMSKIKKYQATSAKNN